MTIPAKGAGHCHCVSSVYLSVYVDCLFSAARFSALAQTTAAPDFSGLIGFSTPQKRTLPRTAQSNPKTIVIDNQEVAIVFTQNRRQEIDGD